ncbi:Ger(x)C family spore germination protein [Metabacillus bambusae]|uniref:Ger(X)C family spore germination protein n=1 Tax=Metabacillus bambusae TaxID=2795218 RepID=A0ABS3NAH0_9BACI|nr:Ger(x)C family spore germination protein [Metabacillus bambusae]MBO1515287.1 Ger(x)C family spore germination protein [Metabacillus bambusae]
MKIRTGVLSLMILCMFSLAGCWNYRELNELAFPLAMGIDKVPHQDEYRFSFQIVNAREIAGQKGGGGVVPVVVYSGTGKTLLEAVRKASKKVPRRISGQHMRDLIIGEELAREGMEEVFDLMERDPEPRLTTRVFIARDSDAETILKTLTPIENIPANAILGKLKTTGKVFAENYEVEIDDVIRGLLTKGGGPVVSGIKLSGETQIGPNRSILEQSDVPAELTVSGMALFKEGKLVKWMEDGEARGISWINNKVNSTIVNLDCENKKDAISIEIISSKTKIKAEIKGEQPLISINIRETGAVMEAMCSINLSKSEELRKLEQQWNEKVKDEVVRAIKEAQDLETDVLGFGEAVERANPKAWKKMEKEWDKIFAKCEVEVKVESKVRRSGEITKPYLFDLKK